MNNRQKELYANLMSLVGSSDAFYFKDFDLDDVTYRVFNYRLASYTDFLGNDALEARGTMFEVNGDTPVRLVAWCPEKFFNIGENPFSMNLDFSRNNIKTIMYKMDGSLISTYRHKGVLMLKTKGSLFSEQAVAAMNYLRRPENKDLHDQMNEVTSWGYTINLEYTAPLNRIVVGYEDERLTILNIRDNDSGNYIEKNLAVNAGHSAMVRHWVEDVSPDDTETFVANIANANGIEGYVIELMNGQKVKAKCDWYVALHHTKDSINSPKRLFECVVNETSDDLRTMFRDDVVALKLIAEMEERVVPKFDHMIKTVESFYGENKLLSRKDYAIKGQSEAADGLFALKMNLYLGRQNDYKEFAIKHPEMFGVREDVIADE